jgi:hypothetical protein
MAVPRPPVPPHDGVFAIRLDVHAPGLRRAQARRLLWRALRVDGVERARRAAVPQAHVIDVLVAADDAARADEIAEALEAALEAVAGVESVCATSVSAARAPSRAA